MQGPQQLDVFFFRPCFYLKRVIIHLFRILKTPPIVNVGTLDSPAGLANPPPAPGGPGFRPPGGESAEPRGGMGGFMRKTSGTAPYGGRPRGSGGCPFTGLFGAALLLGALGAPLSAANLSFLVVETGSGGGGSPVAAPAGLAPPFESSSLWETSLFDVFFEAGHIVSNFPILPMRDSSGADFPGREAPHKEFPRELGPDLRDAAAGGADFFILVLLDYPAEAVERTAKPGQVSLRVYSAAPASRGRGAQGYRFVYEGTSSLRAEGGAPGGGAGLANQPSAPARVGEEAEQAKGLIRGLIPHL
jgi:hypothetical protein